MSNKTLLFDFSLEGKILIKGEGRIGFINGLATNNIKKLEKNQGCKAFFLNKIGKILSDAIVYTFSDHLLINMNIVGKKNLLPLLGDEAALGKSKVEDVSMKYGLFSIQGNDAKQIIETITGEIQLEKEFQSTKQPITINNQQTEIIITKNQRTNQDCYDIYIPANFYSLFKKELLEKNEDNLTLGTNEQFELLRIQSKKPQYGIDFDQNNILPEVTEQGIDFNKGCYVGQEIVVRVKNLAKGITAKKLHYFEIDAKEPIQKSQNILNNDKEAGYITSSAVKDDKTYAFGYLKKDFFHEKELIVNNQKIILVQALQ